uniref:SP-RING-type domain-containing protein n=1 Tax=Heterorhabditis bacteriophora TaxID=37862 RepID=A0A1I7W9Y4_HETBA
MCSMQILFSRLDAKRFMGTKKKGRCPRWTCPLSHH